MAVLPEISMSAETGFEAVQGPKLRRVLVQGRGRSGGYSRDANFISFLSPLVGIVYRRAFVVLCEFVGPSFELTWGLQTGGFTRKSWH